MDTNEFINKANILHNNECGYLRTIFVNSLSKVIITCMIHGDFLQTPNNHLRQPRSIGCPACGEINRILSRTNSLDEFITAANLKHNFRYDYSKVIYISAQTKIIIICKIHGEFLQTPNHHLSGDNCPHCALLSRASLRTKSLDEFITAANLEHNFRYDYSKVIYINCKKKVIIICKKHGEFMQTPDSHIQGVGCPKCNESKGELVVHQYLCKKNIEFEYQYSFEECKNINPLPFDFAITKDSYVVGLVEYQGKQHYIPTNFGSKTISNEEMFENVKKNDRIKFDYCQENVIPLLVISYKQLGEIDSLLTNFIHGL